jgi:hypothetical protein
MKTPRYNTCSTLPCLDTPAVDVQVAPTAIFPLQSTSCSSHASSTESHLVDNCSILNTTAGTFTKQKTSVTHVYITCQFLGILSQPNVAINVSRNFYRSTTLCRRLCLHIRLLIIVCCSSRQDSILWPNELVPSCSRLKRRPLPATRE